MEDDGKVQAGIITNQKNCDYTVYFQNNSFTVYLH